MKPAVKIGLGLFVSVATMGSIFFYDSYLRERIDSEEVVVVKAGKEILKSEQITKDFLVIERRTKNSLVDGVILAENYDDIIGTEAKYDIVGNSMVSKEMLDYDKLVPDISKGEAIRPITKNMIYAQPGSLRRKDLINIYLVNVDKEGQLQSLSSNAGLPATGNMENNNSKPFLEGVKVVYVKDSGNKEVVSAIDGEKDTRLNATSTISDLEIILNEEDFNKLMMEVLGKGSKLYITYQ